MIPLDLALLPTAPRRGLRKIATRYKTGSDPSPYLQACTLTFLMEGLAMEIYYCLPRKTSHLCMSVDPQRPVFQMIE